MANNNTETKYVKWNTFIAITAVLTSTFVSIYTIHKQNNFWKYQNAIETKQQYTQIKIKKIEELNKVFNEFTMHLSQKTFTHLLIMSFASDVSKKPSVPSTLENQLYEWFNMILRNQDIIIELRSNLIWHLETLSPLFSEEIISNAEELAEMIQSYETFGLTTEDMNDITTSPKSLEKMQEIIRERQPNIQNSPIYPKFHSLIEKMYLQVKSGLNVN